MTNRLFLACESEGHLIRDCLFRRMENIILVRPVLPAPLVQRGPRVRADGQRKQAYNLTTEEAIISDKVKTGSGIQYLEQEP